MMVTMSPETLPITAPQARFVVEHRATVGSSSLADPREVFVYRRELAGGWRWLVDSCGIPVQTRHFR
jgi:hypothetical protein